MKKRIYLLFLLALIIVEANSGGRVMSNGLVILVLTVAGLILVIDVMWRKHSLRKQRIERLLSNGVQTDDDYFWLFPGACQNCGSRTFNQVESCELIANTPGLSPDLDRRSLGIFCSRCGPYHDHDSNNDSDYSWIQRTSFVINSRWLTQAQEDKIPQVLPERRSHPK